MRGRQSVSVFCVQRHEHADATSSKAGGVPGNSKRGGVECICSCNIVDDQGYGAQGPLISQSVDQ